MLDLTVGESKKFEQLPDDKWVLARLVKRDVVRWVESEHKFATSSDEVLTKLIAKGKKLNDDGDMYAWRNEVKAYQFSFTFKVLEDKKFAGYVVKGRTGIWLNFTNTDGEEEPNKLAKFYLGAGGERGKKGETLDIDSILGNYIAVRVESNKNKVTRKVYQQVVEVRELSTDELVKAKTNEKEVDKIEKALKEAEEKSLTGTGETNSSVVQAPVMDMPSTTKEVPF